MSEAIKYQFTIAVTKVLITLAEGWQPTSLRLAWRRGERRRNFDIPYDDTCLLNGVVEISCNVSQSMLVTLYKDDGFVKKSYVFDIEDVIGLSVRRLASYTLNIAEHVDEQECVTIQMKSLSQKISDAVVDLNIESNFMKTGSIRDSDMESNFSHVSDDDIEEISTTSLDEVALIQSRAYQRRSQFLDEVNQVNNHTMSRYKNIPSFASLPFMRDELRKSKLKLRKQDDPTQETISKLSAKCQLILFFHFEPIEQKLPRSKSGRTMSFDFQDNDVKEIIHQVCDDDIVARRSLKIKKIELENEALRVRNQHLFSMVGTYKHDVEMMQLEIDDLHRLVQDLRMKVHHTEEENDAPQAQKTKDHKKKEQTLLTGWLCKRGIKGGPLGCRWKRRWFIQCHDQCLYYYKKKTSTQHQGFIELDKIIGVEDVTSTRQDKNNGSFNVLTERRTFSLMAHDERDKQRWINALDYLQTVVKKEKTLKR